MFWIRATIGSLGFAGSVLWYVVLLLFPLSKASRRESYARMLGRLCRWPVGIRLRVVGREHVERVSPCVYACNHQSQLDYPISGAIFPGNCLVMASLIGNWPVLGALYKGSGCITVDKHVAVRAVAALDRAMDAIRRDGNSIWMFVEGTRGHAPAQLGRFRRGAFRLAATTGVPIVPVVISPLKPWTDLRGRRLEPHQVVIHVLEPVYAAGSSHADEDALSAEVRRRMESVLATYRSA